jgi:hypothetical protein
MNQGQKYALILAFFLLSGYFLGLHYPISWNDNDDFVMKQIAQGFYSNSPEANLVFINPLIGFLLKWLYSWKKSTEWYSWLFVLLYAIANSNFVFLFFQNKTTLKTLFLLIIFVLIVLLPINISLQFTILSYFLASSGLMILIRSKHSEESIFKKFLILISLFISFLLRPESFVFAMVFFIPFLIYFRKILFWFKLLSFLLFSFILIAFFIKIYTYNDAKWQSYFHYNNLRYTLVDSPGLKLNQVIEKLSELNIDSSEFKLFQSGFLEYPSHFDTQKISNLNSFIKDEINKELSFYFFSESREYLLWIFGLFILALIAGKRKIVLLALAGFIISLVALLYLSQYRNIYFRVYFPLYGLVMAFFLLAMAEEEKWDKGSWSFPFGLATILSLFFLVSEFLSQEPGAAEKIKIQGKIRAEVEKVIADSCKECKEVGLILGQVTCWTYLDLPVFSKNHFQPKPQITPIMSGWLVRSPHRMELMGRFGNPLESDIKIASENPCLVFYSTKENRDFHRYIHLRYPEFLPDTLFQSDSAQFVLLRIMKRM